MKKLTKAEIIAKLFNNDEETVEFIGAIDNTTEEFTGINNEETAEIV